MEQFLSEKTVPRFITAISEQYRPPTGAVLAVSAAQAVALAESFIQLCLEIRLDQLAWAEVTYQLGELAQIRTRLQQLAESEMAAVSREARTAAGGQADFSLCQTIGEIGELCIRAAITLHEFRPAAIDSVMVDLTIAIDMLEGLAHAALQLVEWRAGKLLEAGTLSECQETRHLLGLCLQQLA